MIFPAFHAMPHSLASGLKMRNQWLYASLELFKTAEQNYSQLEKRKGFTHICLCTSLPDLQSLFSESSTGYGIWLYTTVATLSLCVYSLRRDQLILMKMPWVIFQVHAPDIVVLYLAFDTVTGFCQITHLEHAESLNRHCGELWLALPLNCFLTLCTLV